MEKTLIEKLDINKGSKVLLISPKFNFNIEKDFAGNIGVAATPKGLNQLKEKFDILLIWVEQKEILPSLLPDLEKYINPQGTVWVIIRKKDKRVNKENVITYGERAGFIYNKTASVSDAEYAFGLVIREPKNSGS